MTWLRGFLEWLFKPNPEIITRKMRQARMLRRTIKSSDAKIGVLTHQETRWWRNLAEPSGRISIKD